MKELRELSGHDQQALEEAAQWRLRLQQDPSLELSPEFQDWISRSACLQAFKAVETGWMAVGALGTSPELLALRSQALRRVHRASHRPSRRSLMRVAAALLFLTLAGGGALYVTMFRAANYETDIGMRRVVVLADGSRITLDSSSEVHVRYTDKARKIELEHGRARFDVAHDTTRPFTVTAGDQTVVAVGTSFNVEKIGPKVLVTLIQGRVVIKSAVPEPHQKAQVALSAGEEFVASQGLAPVIQPANLKVASAWEAGQLIFKDVPLAEAAARENRYTDKPIQVDPAVAAIRISGVFNAGDVVSFVSAVTNYFPVQATTGADDQIVLQRRL